jgi:hypothetical protein
MTAMLTIRQAAARLGVSPSVIHRLCREQIISSCYVRLGSRSRLLLAERDVEHYRRLCCMEVAELTPACFFRRPASD